jgi:two-component system alkaline phosphatase synthesis response regulator PhoP
LKLLYLEKSLNCFIYWLKARESFKRDEILDKVWGNEVVVGGRTIVHIRKLREKLELFKTIKE